MKYNKGDKVVCVNNSLYENHLIVGNIYIVATDHSGEREERLVVEPGVMWGSWRFVPANKPKFLEDTIRHAKTFIGKKVKWTKEQYGGTFVASGVKILVDRTEAILSSTLVWDEFQKNGEWVVALGGDPTDPTLVPVDLCEEDTTLSSVTVKLNDCYSAEVDWDGLITVGCQTFPHSVVKDLQDAIDKVTL